MKHCVDRHGGDLENLDMRMRVLKYTRTSFERQILESVLIQENRDHHILNSRSEYNRCSLPRLSTKLGEKEFKQWEKERDEDLEKEEILEMKIREMRKSRNRERGNRSTRGQPAKKRRKICTQEETQNFDNDSDKKEEIINMAKKTEKKRKLNEADDSNPTPRKLKPAQRTIKDFYTRSSEANYDEKMGVAVLRQSGVECANLGCVTLTEHSDEEHVNEVGVASQRKNEVEYAEEGGVALLGYSEDDIKCGNEEGVASAEHSDDEKVNDVGVAVQRQNEAEGPEEGCVAFLGYKADTGCGNEEGVAFAEHSDNEIVNDVGVAVQGQSEAEGPEEGGVAFLGCKAETGCGNEEGVALAEHNDDERVNGVGVALQGQSEAEDVNEGVALLGYSEKNAGDVYGNALGVAMLKGDEIMPGRHSDLGGGNSDTSTTVGTECVKCSLDMAACGCGSRENTGGVATKVIEIEMGVAKKTRLNPTKRSDK